MKPFRSFVPPLAAMLLAASGGAAAQGVLIVTEPNVVVRLPRPIPEPQPPVQSYRIKEI